MTLQSSGPISIAQIHNEFPSGSYDLADLEYVAGLHPRYTRVSMSEFYGRSNLPSSITVYVLSIGGGAGGGGSYGGSEEGAGGGGYGGREGYGRGCSAMTMSPFSNYNIYVGAGGAGGNTGSGGAGSYGGTSFVATSGGNYFVANGGGGGNSGGGPGQPGGSGGGAVGAGQPYGGGAGTPGQGYPGGTGYHYNPGGGGGGSGGPAGYCQLLYCCCGCSYHYCQQSYGGVGMSVSFNQFSTGMLAWGGGGGGNQYAGGGGLSGSRGLGNCGQGGSSAGYPYGNGQPSYTYGSGGGGNTAGNAFCPSYPGGYGYSGVVVIEYVYGKQLFNGGSVSRSGCVWAHVFTSSGCLTGVGY